MTMHLSMPDRLIVTKASGKTEAFSEAKLLNSLINAGTTEEVARKIVAGVRPHLYAGISTKNIYQSAFSLLRKTSRHLAGRYHLKRGIMELGPSGFPFEVYIAEILKSQGYRVDVGTSVKGHCVNHEIDVIAQKDDNHFMIECKYHSQQGLACTVKIPLYIQSRFKDVEAVWIQQPKHRKKIHQGWVVTNTRFTKDAIQYGECAGLKLLAWDYPQKNNLKNQIDELGLYPLTCLTSLTRQEKQLLLNKKIVLCLDVCRDEHLLLEIGLSQSRIKKVVEEGRRLCQSLIQKSNHQHQL